MDKADIITQLRAKFQEEFDTLNSGKSVDQNPERLQKRLEELKHTLEVNQEVTPQNETIDIGALVAYEEVGKQFFCLILPGCLGDMLDHDGKKIACVSPDSHIAAAMLGKKVGDMIEVQSGKITRKLKVVNIL